MSLLKFENSPSNKTPINAPNLNNNFGYTVPVGGIVEFAGATAPKGWLLCDGSAVSRTDYAELFETIGITFGAGDGSTTFNLPNRKGKTGVGVDSSNEKFASIGATFGEEEHKLTIDEMPKHKHIGLLSSNGGELTVFGTTSGGSEMIVDLTSYYPNGAVNSTINTKEAGSSDKHNNIQPSIAMNYIIKC